MLRKLLAAALFVLAAATPALAANKLYISEYNALGITQTAGTPAQIASEPNVTDQTAVDYSGGVASSAAFNTNTSFVRLLCTSTCSVKFGASPTATTANKPLAAGAPEYFAVVPGQKVSVISNTDF